MPVDCDLVTDLTINSLMQSQVGKLLDVLREAGFDVEINLSKKIDE